MTTHEGAGAFDLGGAGAAGVACAACGIEAGRSGGDGLPSGRGLDQPDGERDAVPVPAFLPALSGFRFH